MADTSGHKRQGSGNVPAPPPEPPKTSPSVTEYPAGAAGGYRTKGVRWRGRQFHKAAPTVWRDFDYGRRIPVDNDLAPLFAIEGPKPSESPKASATDQSSPQSATAAEKPEELEEVGHEGLLDGNTKLGGEMLITSLKKAGKTEADLIRAVHQIDFTFPEQFISNLAFLLQSVDDDTVDNIKFFAHMKSKLTSISPFLALVMDLVGHDNWHGRLEVLKENIQREKDVRALEDQVLRLETCANQLKEKNANFNKILEIILAIGNAINEGTPPTAGFDLDFINTLDSYVAVGKKRTLLSYVISFVQKEHSAVATWVEDLNAFTTQPFDIPAAKIHIYDFSVRVKLFTSLWEKLAPAAQKKWVGRSEILVQRYEVVTVTWNALCQRYSASKDLYHILSKFRDTWNKTLHKSQEERGGGKRIIAEVPQKRETSTEKELAELKEQLNRSEVTMEEYGLRLKSLLMGRYRELEKEETTLLRDLTQQ